MADKVTRARKRKEEYIAQIRRIQELEKRLGTPTSAKKKQQQPQQRHRRKSVANSVSQFFREMLDSEYVSEPQYEIEVKPKRRDDEIVIEPKRHNVTNGGTIAEIKPQRRGSGPIVVRDKRGQKIAEFPVYPKSQRVPDDPNLPAGQDPLAKAIRRLRGVIVDGDEEDDGTANEVKESRYARNPDGTIKTRCTPLQKLLNRKCTVKVLMTPEERQRDLELKRAKAAANNYHVEVPRLVDLPDGRGRRGLTPTEKRRALKEANKEATLVHVNMAQAKHAAELAEMNLGKRRLSADRLAAAGAAIAHRVDKFAGIPVQDFVVDDMEPDDEPVLDDEISEFDGRQVRLRFIPPKRGFFSGWF